MKMCTRQIPTLMTNGTAIMTGHRIKLLLIINVLRGNWQRMTEKNTIKTIGTAKTIEEDH